MILISLLSISFIRYALEFSYATCSRLSATLDRYFLRLALYLHEPEVRPRSIPDRDTKRTKFNAII